MGPHPRCIIWHWATCTGPDGRVTDVVFKRVQLLRSDHDFAEKYGLGVLRDSISSSLRGEKRLPLSYYLIGAAFWPAMTGLFERILQNLTSQDQELRIAATFAATYYMDVEQVACLLAERVVVEEGDPLTVDATREVLEIGAALKLGGSCPRCGRRRESTTPRLSDLVTEIRVKKELSP